VEIVMKKLNRFSRARIQSPTYKLLCWLRVLAVEDVYKLLSKGVE
jgi:hypothetical protein